MASPADGLTRLHKVAVFLITIGEEQARELLDDVVLRTVEQINTAILELGPLRPEVKAAVMIEFSDFFCNGKPLVEKLAKPEAKRQAPAGGKTRSGKKPGKKQPAAGKKPTAKKPPPAAPAEDPAGEEVDIAATLEKLRQRIDPGKIDWGRAGYDFGDGFKGLDQDRR